MVVSGKSAVNGVNRGSVSPSRQQLIRLMQKIDFGHIEDLEIRDGEPVMNPLLRTMTTIKLGRGAASAHIRPCGDFALKTEVIDLFELFDRHGSFPIQRIEIRGGLPFLVDIMDVTRAA